jgi:hypothetical protein
MGKEEMKAIRNAYFWLFLGSVAFIAFSYWVASTPVSQKEWNAMAKGLSDPPSKPPSEFWMGFGTACIVAGAWVVVYRQKHPKSKGELRRDDSD